MNRYKSNTKRQQLKVEKMYKRNERKTWCKKESIGESLREIKKIKKRIKERCWTKQKQHKGQKTIVIWKK